MIFIKTFYIAVLLYSLVLKCFIDCRISNERRCVDAECSVPISLATTLLRYNADDDRLLSFPRNVRAKVFSKEAGDKPTLWEAEINGKRGYVPKDLLREDKMLIKPNEIKFIVPTGRVDKPKENVTEENQGQQILSNTGDKSKQNVTEENQERLGDSVSADVAETPKLPTANSKGFFSTIAVVSADSVPQNSPDISPQPTRNYQVYEGTTVYDDSGREFSESPPHGASTVKKTPSISKIPSLDESITVTENFVEETPVASEQPDFETTGKEIEKSKRESLQNTKKIKEPKDNAIEHDPQEEGTPETVNTSSEPSVLGNFINKVTKFISSGSGENEIEEEDEDETISVEDENDTEGESSGEEENYADVPVKSIEKDNDESKNITDEKLIPNEDIKSKEANELNESDILDSKKELDQDSKSDDSLKYLQQNENLSEKPLVQHNISVGVIVEGEKDRQSKEVKDTDGKVSHFEMDNTADTLSDNFSNPVSDDIIGNTLETDSLQTNIHVETDSLQTNIHESVKDVKTSDGSIVDKGSETKTNEAMDISTQEFQQEPTNLPLELHKEINNLENKTFSADTLEGDTHITIDTGNSVDSNISQVFSKSEEVNTVLETQSVLDQSKIKPIYEEQDETGGQPHLTLTSAQEFLFGSRNTVDDSSEQPSVMSAETEQQPKTAIEETKPEPTPHVQDTISSDSSDTSKIVQRPTESPTYSSEDKDSLRTTTAEVRQEDGKEDSLKTPIMEVRQEDDKEDSLKTQSMEVMQEGDKEDSLKTPSMEMRQEDGNEDSLKTSSVEVSMGDGNEDSLNAPGVEVRKEGGIETMNNELGQKDGDKDLGDASVQDSVEPFMDSIPLDQTKTTQDIPDQGSHLQEVEIQDTFSLESSENISTDTEAVEDLTANPLLEEPSEGLYSWLSPVFNLFASRSEPTEIETAVPSSGDSNLETVHIPFIKDESCLADGVGEEACETLQEISRSKDVAWQDSVYPAEMSSAIDLLDRVPLEATILLIITAVVILVFSLGHYYIEAHRRDGPLVAVINKLEREVLILKKESCILEDKIHTAEEQLEAWNTNSSENDALIVELKQELEETRAAKTELEEQVAVLEREVETVTESGMEMHRLLEESLSSHDGSQVLLSTVETLREKLEHQENEIAGLSHSLSQKNVEVEELKEKLVQAAMVASGMEDRIISITRNKEEEALQLKDKHRQLIAQLEEVMETKALDETRVSTDMSKLRLMIEELQKTLAERDLELEEVKEVVKQLRSTDSNDKMDALFDVVGVRTRLKAAVTERDELREKFQEEEGARKLLEGHMKKITQEVEDLKNRFETAEKEKIEALTKLQVLSNYFKEKESQLQKELGLQESMWLQKQSDDHTIYEQMRSLREENEKYKLQNESLKKEIVEQESSFKIQLANTEQKAHENWVTSRQAERRLKEVQQEASQLRNRLTMEKNTSAYSLDDSKQNISESNGDPSSPPPSLMFPPTTSPPFMMYPMPSPGDFVPPPPLMGSPYHPDGLSRPPPLGRISSPPLDHRFSPPPPLPYPPYDYPPYGHHSPSPPPPMPPHSHHRNVHKPQPREMSREQKDHGMSNFPPEADKTTRRNKR